MSTKKPSISKLPTLTKPKTSSSHISTGSKEKNGPIDHAHSPPINSLPSLPSSPLVADTRSLLSRTSSKRSRLKSQLSQSVPWAMEEDYNDERRTSSDPGARGNTSRHPSVISTIGAEDAADLGHSISIGGKMVPMAYGSNTPSPSTPVNARGRVSRPRSSSVAARQGRGSSEGNFRRSRNSGSSQELALRKDGIYERQSLSDEAKRSSVNSGPITASSPQWAGHLTTAVQELSQEINRLREYSGPIAITPVVTATVPGSGSGVGSGVGSGPGPVPQTQNSSKPKSTSIFWNQSGFQNGSVKT